MPLSAVKNYNELINCQFTTITNGSNFSTLLYKNSLFRIKTAQRKRMQRKSLDECLEIRAANRKQDS